MDLFINNKKKYKRSEILSYYDTMKNKRFTIATEESKKVNVHLLKFIPSDVKITGGVIDIFIF